MTDLYLLGGQAAFIVAIAACAQAVSGFGFAVAGVPLLSLLVAPDTAVVAMTGLGAVLAAGAWRQERAHVEGTAVRHLVLASGVGIPIGLLLLLTMPPHLLLLVIAATVLATAVFIGANVSLQPTRLGQWLLGMSSGAFLASTGINGPPLILALSTRQLPPRRFRATLQSIFFVQEVVVVAAFLVLGRLTPEVLTIVAAGLIGAPLGWSVGSRVFKRLPAHVFRYVVCAGLSAAGGGALATVLV